MSVTSPTVTDSRVTAFFVPGEPQGKGRARSYVKRDRGGKAILNGRGRVTIGHVTPKKTRSYEEEIGWLATDARNHPASSAPIALVLEIRKSIPASWPKWKKALAATGLIRPTTKPDGDNVLKAVKDACNGVLWLDDCQVVDEHVRAYYVQERPGLIVQVSPLAAFPASLTSKPPEGLPSAKSSPLALHAPGPHFV